ncbi:MAG: NAD-dependent epimerase/dehydratase family protein [Planctomycetaceae bacterium]|jgi:nucleoside-diphosphate-sugar epimerase|nr:NAD-dependent epimerase/dehydratase family protein [Planctomycetaceae bacterium]
MQRVLITGSSGFIGFHLIQHLQKEGCEVRCLVRTDSVINQLKMFDVELCYGELADSDSLTQAVKGCDVVFHLAGRVRARNSREFDETNHLGTKNLVNAAARCSVLPVFVHVSSLAAVGPSNREKPKQETDLPQPISAYGKSKLEGEKAVTAVSDRLPCSIIRPGIVFGEADRMNLELFKTIDNFGFCPVPGFRDKIYSWIHAADLSELLITVAKSGERIVPNTPVGTGIYFATNNDGIGLFEVGREIGRVLGRQRVRMFRCLPIALFSISTFYEILKRMSGINSPYDWAKAWESLHHWRCSPEKAQQQLGFSPLASFSERINQTACWYKKYHWL